MYLYTGSNKVNEVQILLDVDLSMPVRNYWPDSDLGTNPNLFNCKNILHSINIKVECKLTL